MILARNSKFNYPCPHGRFRWKYLCVDLRISGQVKIWTVTDMNNEVSEKLNIRTVIRI